jgi:hypothetical protein
VSAVGVGGFAIPPPQQQTNEGLGSQILVSLATLGSFLVKGVVGVVTTLSVGAAAIAVKLGGAALSWLIWGYLLVLYLCVQLIVFLMKRILKKMYERRARRKKRRSVELKVNQSNNAEFFGLEDSQHEVDEDENE